MTTTVALKRLIADPRHSDMTIRQVGLAERLHATAKAGCTVRGMAADLGIDKPVVTRAADRLQELGYLTREVDRKDRRSVFLVLTPAGRRFVCDLVQADTPRMQAGVDYDATAGGGLAGHA